MSDRGGKHRASPSDASLDLLELVALLALLKQAESTEAKQDA